MSTIEVKINYCFYFILINYLLTNYRWTFAEKQIFVMDFREVNKKIYNVRRKENSLYFYIGEEN